jgi:hypothetical protein
LFSSFICTFLTTSLFFPQRNPAERRNVCASCGTSESSIRKRYPTNMHHTRHRFQCKRTYDQRCHKYTQLQQQSSAMQAITSATRTNAEQRQTSYRETRGKIKAKQADSPDTTTWQATAPPCGEPVVASALLGSPPDPGPLVLPRPQAPPLLPAHTPPTVLFSVLDPGGPCFHFRDARSSHAYTHAVCIALRTPRSEQHHSRHQRSRKKDTHRPQTVATILHHAWCRQGPWPHSPPPGRCVVRRQCTATGTASRCRR